jgi:hypothetical protein
MRLSGWRKTAPAKESMSNEVLAVLKPVLVDLGAEADPTCWVVWGEDPHLRYSVLVPTMAGLITASVRTSGPEGGPRTAAKLTRWTKLTVSELNLESSGGHRIVAVQVEAIVLKGVDDDADRICEFARGLIAEIDDRHPQAAPIAVLQSPAAKAEAAAPASGSVESPAAPAAPKRTPKAAARPAQKATPKRGAEPYPAEIAMAAFQVKTPPVPGPATGPDLVAASGSVTAPQPAGIPVAAPAGGGVQPAAQASAKRKAAAAAKPAPGQAATPPALGPGTAAMPGAAAPPTAAETPAAAAPSPAPATTPPGPAPTPPAPPAADVELDRSKWIAPHPIEAVVHKPNKSRPWRP